MRLSAMQNRLNVELSSENTHGFFQEIKKKHIELQKYSTIHSIIIMLQDRFVAGYEAQQNILHLLVSQAQAHPVEEFWRKLLLLAFIPGLNKIRSKTIPRMHDPEDLDAFLWTSFFQVLHTYPLKRNGSIAAGILLDTRKAYFKFLRKQQDARQHEIELVTYANQVSEKDAEFFDPFELQPPEFEIGPHDFPEIHAALKACGALSSEDVELIQATDIEGNSMLHYMKRHGLLTGNSASDKREQDRLWRRRLRARDTLQKLFSKKIHPACPFSAF